jgi:hypothetical protein
VFACWIPFKQDKVLFDVNKIWRANLLKGADRQREPYRGEGGMGGLAKRTINAKFYGKMHRENLEIWFSALVSCPE